MRKTGSHHTFLLPLVMAFVLCVLCLTNNVTLACAADSHETQPTESDKGLWVYIFDVGQADCVLIKDDEYAVLIDAGNIGQDSLILEYLKQCGVNTLDILVATHPHSDHIGSMAAVIKGMDTVETLLMPDVVHTTVTFERLLDAIEEKDLEVTIPQSGDVYELGDIIIQVLAPNSGEYRNLNNYSIVIRVVYGQTIFLFTGDAEGISEVEQLEKDYELDADVLKVGHHGSHSSTTEEYLTAVSPSYAVISCGKDNMYGHPHNETMLTLASYDILVYRTDEMGTIVFNSDGTAVTVSSGDLTTLSADGESIPNENEIIYIGNKNSKIFHLPTCSSLPLDKNRIYFNTRSEAADNQYQPCKRCNP